MLYNTVHIRIGYGAHDIIMYIHISQHNNNIMQTLDLYAGMQKAVYAGLNKSAYACISLRMQTSYTDLNKSAYADLCLHMHA